MDTPSRINHRWKRPRQAALLVALVLLLALGAAFFVVPSRSRHAIGVPSPGTVPTQTAAGAPDPVLAPATADLPPVLPPPDVVLPDRGRTPGAINPAVSQATIAKTICVRGFTATIRPPASYTSALKRQQLASGYTLGGDTNPADYEEDHLVSLELGGNPTDVRNLWPEPYAASGARVKDRVENKLHELVCAGSLPLAVAQADIATNWYAAYLKYVGPVGSLSPTPTPSA